MGSESGSPLDGQGETTTQREATPKGPGEKEGGQQPGGEKPGAEKQGTKPGDGQESEGGTPKGNKDSKGPGKNSNGPTPAAGATEGANSNAAGQVDRWGDLPVHARDVFQNQGGSALPTRYRDWIDQYYKKLNKKP